MDRLLKDAMTTRSHAAPLGQCPDAETLAAWADGTIYGAEADVLEAHLADCTRCQAVLAAFSVTEPEDAAITEAQPEGATASETPVIPFRPRPSPLRWAVPLMAGTAAASLILYMAWPKPSAPLVSDQTATVARSEPNAAPPVTSPALPAEANGPVRTPSIGPATAETKAGASQKPAARIDAVTSSPQPALPQPLQTSAAAPGQIISPSPKVLLSPAPVTTSPTPTAVAGTTTADLVRVVPPPVSSNASASLRTLQRSDRNDLSLPTELPGGGVEFGPPDPIANVTLTPTRQGAASRNPMKIRWKVVSGLVQKSIDGGLTWTRTTLDPALGLTTGASPSTMVCWLVGKAGAVMRSTDAGATWARVTAPDSADLVSVTATDAENATVATADGRRLTTADGGQTWHR